MENTKQLKHILMVDDVTTNLKCAAQVLKEYYKLSMAKSGAQALELLEKVKPNLILLDIKMPDMDGYETLECIRGNPETAMIPVIFLTADSERESEIKGLRMGAMDFIRKPFEPEVMLSRIEKILQIEDMRKNLAISARRDVLTNLWNRKYMEEEVTKFVEKTDAKGIFFILDMDNFKGINDNFGHIMGDVVLVEFANTLRTLTGKKDIISRIGGDEFAVFIKGLYTVQEISSLAENIIVSIEKNVNSILVDGHDVSVSIGIAQLPADATNFMQLYNKADKALYFVKQNGKRGFHFYQDKEDYTYGSEKIDVAVDLHNLKQFVEEKCYFNGAYKVEYEGFKYIYQFISRCVGRTKQCVQLVLFTISGPALMMEDEEVMLPAMKKLEQSIVASLRRGDVATHFSSSQYVIILMDANIENGELVAERVLSTWKNINDIDQIDVHYDIGDVLNKKTALDLNGIKNVNLVN